MSDRVMAFTLAHDFENATFKPAGVHLQFLPTMFDQLESWSETLRKVRAE